MEEELEAADNFRIIEYPFHLGDLIGGTTNLDDSQFGAYMRILIANINAQAKKGGLPNNQEILRSYTRMGPAAWKKLWFLIGDKFVEENGMIYHPRVKETVNKIVKNSNTARANRLKALETPSTPVKPPLHHSATNPKTQKPNTQKPKDKNPDSLPKGRAPGDDSGSGFLNDGGKGPPLARRGFDIERYLDDKTREAAKAHRGAWDFYALISEYNEWIGKIGEPNNPKAHFIAFVKKKGKNAP